MTTKRKINNVTQVVLVNNTEKTIDLTPGTDVRWDVLSMIIINPDDVQRNNCSIYSYAEAAATNQIQYIALLNLAAGERIQWPNSDDLAQGYSNMFSRVIIEGAEIIRFRWPAGGASTGGTDDDGCVCQVLEEAI